MSAYSIAKPPSLVNSSPTLGPTNSTRRISTSSPRRRIIFELSFALEIDCGSKRINISLVEPKYCTFTPLNFASLNVERTLDRSTLSLYPTSINVPPVKSIPNFSPWFTSENIETEINITEKIIA